MTFSLFYSWRYFERCNLSFSDLHTSSSYWLWTKPLALHYMFWFSILRTHRTNLLQLKYPSFPKCLLPSTDAHSPDFPFIPCAALFFKRNDRSVSTNFCYIAQILNNRYIRCLSEKVDVLIKVCLSLFNKVLFRHNISVTTDLGFSDLMMSHPIDPAHSCSLILLIASSQIVTKRV